MSEHNLIGSAPAKVVPLNQKTNEAAIHDFFFFYMHQTSPIMITFLDQLYNEYLKSERWQYATISEKTIAEFNYQLLKKLLEDIKQQ
jgi:hypothetical protein